MGELTIRLNDAELVATLERMASLHGNSVNAEVRGLLVNATRRFEDRLERVRRADAIAAMTPKGVKQKFSIKTVHECKG